MTKNNNNKVLTNYFGDSLSTTGDTLSIVIIRTEQVVACLEKDLALLEMYTFFCVGNKGGLGLGFVISCFLNDFYLFFILFYLFYFFPSKMQEN